MQVTPTTREAFDVSSTPKDDLYSYFCKYDELTDVVACPGITFTSLENSCYVSIEDIFGDSPDE